MMNEFEKAKSLLMEFKGNSYSFGEGTLGKVGSIAASAGKE